MEHKMSNSVEKTTKKVNVSCFVGSDSEDPQKDFIWCLHFATEAHKDQKRKDIDRTPYINHPIGVAYIVMEEAGLANLDLIRGCLLHDTVEDTAVDIEVVRAKFGEYIGDLVQEVTDDKGLPKQERKNLQIVHAKHSSPQAKVVKLADKLYNLRDLERSLPKGWSEERRREYYKWAFLVCKGLRGINPKLEEKLDEFFNRRGLISPGEQCEESFVLPLWTTNDELKPLLTAAHFAAEKHSRHFVLDSTNYVPFINHVVSVAFIVSQEAEIQHIPVLCAALLYSVVNKTNTTIEEVGRLFGIEVGQLVGELTYDQSHSIEEQFKNQISRASTMSYFAKVITLAIITDNCRRLQMFDPVDWPQQLRENYFKWAFQLYKRLANTHLQLEKQLRNIWVEQDMM